MKENKYDDSSFYEAYNEMDRSKKGLAGAGEWHVLKQMLPEFKNKRVLDLGCGFGWHCMYAAQMGAASVLGVDISQKMLERAQSNKGALNIEYLLCPIEDLTLNPGSFDIVISSLAFHYIEDYNWICEQVNRWLKDKGKFVFSVEHPVFTAGFKQQWCLGDNGENRHWPVDNYMDEGLRETVFLSHSVHKYHRTLETYINTLIQAGFTIDRISEPKPSPELLNGDKAMMDELRRPMFLMISAAKI